MVWFKAGKRHLFEIAELQFHRFLIFQGSATHFYDKIHGRITVGYTRLETAESGTIGNGLPHLFISRYYKTILLCHL